MDILSDAEIGTTIAEQNHFEEKVLQMGFGGKDLLKTFDLNYTNATVQMMWRIWIASRECHFERRVEAAVEKALVPYYAPGQEVAVAFEGAHAFRGCPASWKNQVFARIEWFQFNEKSSLDVMGLRGWQLSPNQSGTVVEKLSKAWDPGHKSD